MRLILLVYFIIGIISGVVIASLAWASVLIKRWLIGNILYQEIDGEPKPYLSLDLDKYPEEFKTNKYVLCRVKVKSLDVPEGAYKKPPRK